MSGWYHKNDSSTVLIFIHGLLSSSEICWTSSCNIHWPNLILKDERFLEPSIFLADYHTSVGSNGYGIESCSKEILAQIKRQDSNLNSPPLNKQNIVFITHSAGGIVARHLIESNQHMFKEKKVGLCLYASPSYGSKLANTGSIITSFFGHKLGKELRWGSSLLKDLDVKFQKLLTVGDLNLVGFEAIENRGIFGRVRVVNTTSAARYFDEQILVADSDHSSIVKPTSIESPSHSILLDFFTAENFIDSVKGTLKPRYPSLFDRYSTSVEPYYFERDADKQLPGILSQYNVWLSGVSGYGKTAAITRCIDMSGYDVVYIALSMCIDFDVKGLLNEILRQLNPTFLDQQDIEVAECIRLLEKFITDSGDKKPYCLLIEEIPISDQAMFDEFSQCIYSVITTIDQTDNVRLCLSSIFQPKEINELETQKLSERLRVVVWDEWNIEDLESLAKLLSEDTSLNILTDLFFVDLAGSPRLLKNYFRDELARML